jgi:hypothetical protein
MPSKDIIVKFEPINFLKDKMRRFKKKYPHLMVELIRYDENEVICSINKHHFIYILKNFAECSTYCKLHEEAYLHICIQ